MDTEAFGLLDQIEIAGHPLTFEQVNLAFDGGLRLTAKGGYLPLEGEDFSFEEIDVLLSTHNLFFGRIYPKKINISNIYIPEIHVTDEFVSVGTWQVPIEGDAASIDIVELLKTHEDFFPYLSALKSVKVERSEIKINDQVRGKRWRVKPIQLAFNKSFLDGESLVVETRIQEISEDSSIETPMKIKVHHPRQADFINANLRIKRLDSKVWSEYALGSDILTGFVNANLSARLELKGYLADLSIQLQTEESSVFVNNVYSNPLKFRKIDLHINVMDDLNNVIIHHIEGKDTKGWPFKISGTLNNLVDEKKPHLDLLLTGLGTTNLHDMNAYLPDREIPEVVGWIEEQVHASRVSDLVLMYKGDPTRIPYCDDGCGFHGTFNFDQMDVQFIPTLPVTRGMAGSFLMKDGRITINSDAGSIENQKLGHAQVDIYDFFGTTDAEAMLSVSGTVVGGADELLSHIEGIVEPESAWNIELEGTHNSHLTMNIPLDDSGFENIEMAVSSRVSNLCSNQFTQGKWLEVAKGTVRVTKERAGRFDMRVEGKGSIDSIPTHFTWNENLHKTFEESKIVASGMLPLNRFDTAVQDWGIDIQQDIPTEVTITQLDQPTPLFSIKMDLAENDVAIQPLEWSKPKGEDLLMVAQLSADKSEQYHLKNIHLHGEDVDVEGRIDNVLEFDPIVDFHKFNIGKSRAKFAYQNNHINIVGQILDLSFLDLKNTDTQQASVGDSFLSVSVEQLLLKNGSFDTVDFEMKRETGALQNMKFSSALPEDKTLTLIIKRENSSDDLLIHADVGDAGYALSTLGLYNDFNKGRMTLGGRLQENGRGDLQVSIKDVNLLKAPALFKLFSIMSVEDLISFERGVGFDSIQLPLIINENEYIFDTLTMKGPSVNLRLKGKLTKVDEQLDVKGQLMPVSRVNKLIAKIPIVGDVITGSQKGLLVADFTAKGSLDDPDVSTNPFSLITPGILKDVWGVVVGEGHDPTKPTVKNEPKKGGNPK